MQLESMSQLSEIYEDSFNKAQIIFKHSTTCSISQMAKSRIESTWNIKNVAIYYLDLKRYRDVSNEIASKWSVHHESPQVILIKDGKAVYDESHLDIQVEQLAKAII